MKIRHCLALAVLPLLLSAAFAAAGPVEPDIPARLKAVRSGDFEGQDQVLVFDRTEVDVAETGLSTMNFHQLIKVLTVEGAVRNMSRIFEYDPKSSKVEIRKISIWRDGREMVQDLAAVKDVVSPARAIYWGNRALVMQLARLKPGDGVEIQTARKGFILALLAGGEDEERYIPPMRGHFYDIVPFYSSIPVLEKSYSVRIDRDKPLQYKFFNGAAETEARLEGDRLVYRWVQRNIQPLKTEPNMGSPDDVAPKLIVTSTATWNEKSAWFYKANEDYPAFAVTPEVKKKVDELLAGVTDEEKKLYILTHWVAENIRYSGLSMGKGEGYILHPGAMTFRDRCGVCKDKAGMLVTMLRAAGFDSYPAMTMAGSRIEDIPSDQFNHSVTVVRRGDGRYQLLDPTWVPGTRELWSSLEQEQQYLMGVPETAGLMTTPWSEPGKHTIQVTSDCAILNNGDLTAAVDIAAEGQGDAAIRRNMLRLPRATWRNYIDGMATAIAPGAVVDAVEFSDPYDLAGPMRIKLRFHSPGYAQIAGDEILFKSPVLKQYLTDGATAFFLNIKTDAAERTYPVNGRCTLNCRWLETVRLPDGFRLKEIPAAVALDGPAAAFTRTVAQEPGMLTIRQELTLKKRIFPVEDYANLKPVLDTLNAQRTRVFVLSKTEVQ